MRAAADTYCAPLLAEVELLARDPATAEQILRALCFRLEQANDFGHLASRASDLAEALVELEAFDEAGEWTRLAERHAASDDVNAQLMWRPVRARVHASRGELEPAEALAREGVALADATDDLARRAKAQRDLCHVLVAAGRTGEAASAFERALALYERKGSLVRAAEIRAIREERVIA